MGLSTPAAFEVPGHRLVRPLGKGGMATVYLAIQASLGRPVAVKVLQAPSDEAITRFEQEARTIARLQHPHIVAIYEVGRTSDGQLYYTMPYLPNGDLSKLDLRDTPARVAAVIRALIGALGHAHRNGIVHRDVKPENVLFDQHQRALLTDFGIARASDSLRVTREGATMGSSGYMSPEQARGLEIDGRSDLYSLGIVCFELLTGDLPFRGADALSTAIAHIEQPVPRLPPLKRTWQTFVDKVLAKAPADRFQNAQEMLAALDTIDGRQVTRAAAVKAPKPRAREPALAAQHQRAWRNVVAPLALLILIALAATFAWRHAWYEQEAVQSSTRHGLQTAHDSDHAIPSLTAIAGTNTVVTSAASASVPASVPASGSGSSVRAAPADSAQIAALLAQGDALFAQGKLTEPKDNSAADRYLAVLKLQSDNTLAHADLGRVVLVLQRGADRAWRRDDAAHVLALARKADLLAASADGSAQASWRKARAQLAVAVGTAMANAAKAHDANRIETLRTLAKTLPATWPAGFDPAQLDRVTATTTSPHAGAEMRDSGGPPLVYVPAAASASAFAVGRSEITRNEYAQFAHATGRAAAPCLEANNPFSRMHGWKWNAPGFAQSGNHPVVCVSWDDAVAYAAWLSRRTGQSYRLLNDAEWLRVAHGGGGGNPCMRGNIDDSSRQSKLDNDRWPCNDGAAQTAPVGLYAASGVGAYDMYGNVSEWLAGGSAHNRAFRGLSWRDGSHETALGRRGTAASDIGYTSVGFRVMRVIDVAHPPPG